MVTSAERPVDHVLIFSDKVAPRRLLPALLKRQAHEIIKPAMAPPAPLFRRKLFMSNIDTVIPLSLAWQMMRRRLYGHRTAR